jgi:hypothetical protein
MSMHRIINILLALLICAMLSTSYLLDGPTDQQAAQQQAQSMRDAQQAAHVDQHLAKARKAAGVEL